MKKLLRGVAVIPFLIGITFNLYAQTSGTLTFTFTQVSQSPTYSGTKNALAVWIQTGSGAGGTFVKTKMRYAGAGQGTSDHLPTFSVAAGGTSTNCMATSVNITDATTGATLSSFGTRTITWDGKNVSGTANGTTVADGTYSVAVQETWNHGTTGTATAYFSFTKGPNPVSTTFPNTAQFSNITLTWTPVTTGAINTGSITGSPFCAGQTGISIPYTATGTYNSGNVFTAQLSNASGSFSAPTTLGTLTSTATSGTITSTVALPNTAGTGYRIRVIASNPSVTGTDNGSNLTINAAPTTANAGSAQTVCTTATVTLAGNTPSVGTGTWSKVAGTGNITNSGSPTSTVTGLGAGANTFRWTISSGSCTSTSDVIITGVAAPTTASAGTNQSVCGSSATLAGNTAASGTGTWTLAGGTGTITTPSSPTSAVTGLGTGANTFRWTISNAPCTASASDVIITSVAAPTTASAGPNQTVCATSATLAGNSPSVGSGTWSLVGGSGSITTPSSPTSAVTGLGTGANTFRWTITNAPCTPSTSDVIITQSGNVTAANAGPDQSVCGSNATLAGNTPSSGTGTWTRVAGSGTITTASSATSTVTGLGAGANTFRWTITNGSCAPVSDDVIITGVAAPSTANAGSNQTVCANSATLAGNSPASGTGTWSLVGGTGTITNPSSPTSTVTGLGAGANTFRWTISNVPCTASTADVIITQSGNLTAANAGADQSVCGTSATLAGNAPAVGAGAWTKVAGSGTISNASNPTSTVTGLGTGASTFRWTISNGSCTPSTDDVIITGYANPTASNAGANQNICASTATLAGNTPTIGSGTWTMVNGAGTITNPSNAASTVTGLAVGANTFRWTISNGSCTPSTSNVIITVTAAPTASAAGPDQTVCGSTATLAGNSPSTGSGTWSLVGGTGTITNPSSPASAVTGLGTGANTFRWTISNGASCTSSSDDVILTSVAAPATANAGPNQTLCNTTATLSGNTPASGTGSWSLVSGAGTITNAGNPGTTVTGLGTGANVFRWTIAGSAPCPSSTSDVTITYDCSNNSITTGTISGSPFCASTSYTLMVPFTANGSFSGYYSVELSDAGGSFANPVVIGAGNSSPISAVIPSGTSPGTSYRIRVTNSNPLKAGSDNGTDLAINSCPSNSITTGVISGSPFCSNTTYSVQVPFTYSGTYSGPFTVELSDAGGSFAQPVAIGYGVASPINATIPSATVAGTNYRIRVSNSAASVTGADNGVNLEINNCMAIITGSLSSNAYGSSTTYTLSVSFATVGAIDGPFMVQLSDASGSFDVPVTIGYGNASPVTVTIPEGTPAGNNYRIRVIDYTSGTQGSDNGSNISINMDLVSAVYNANYANGIVVYPNPSQGSFAIRHPFSGNATVTVVNTLGETVYEQAAVLTANSPYSVEMGSASKGIYVLKIQAEDRIYQSTIMVY